MKCYHCGKEKELTYCEECISEIITENLKLQARVKKLEKQLKNREYKPKHMKEEVEEYKLLNNELALDGIKRHIPFLD